MMRKSVGVVGRRAWVLGAAAALAAGGLTALAPAVNAQPVSGVQQQLITDTSHPYESWQCARRQVSVRTLGRVLDIKLGDESRVLLPARAASGARYVAPGDATTEFWSKGGQAQLTWSGQVLPTCVQADAVATPFRASGNEPFWSLEYDGWQVVLQQPGVAPQTMPAQVSARHADGLTLHAGQGSQAVRVVIRSGVCQDTMSDLSRPYRVSLQREGDAAVRQGCGGNPAQLVQGARWVISAVDGQPLAAPAWLEFLPDNRLAGSNGCNRLIGGYTFTGEGLTFDQLGSTRMACAPALMQQEAVLGRYFSSVRSVMFDAEGRLVLHTDAGNLLATADD